jgi:hypothetical protein
VSTCARGRIGKRLPQMHKHGVSIALALPGLIRWDEVVPVPIGANSNAKSEQATSGGNAGDCVVFCFAD